MRCGSNYSAHLAVAQPVAFRETADCLTAAYGTKWNGNASADNGSLFAAQAMQVRRLTPTECERLQGFPDGYTNILWRNKSECPDGPRYKALGNSMAVPVMQWIGKRINNLI
jgi:DNA (cytosine-5)-methyltransferase 1